MYIKGPNQAPSKWIFCNYFKVTTPEQVKFAIAQHCIDPNYNSNTSLVSDYVLLDRVSQTDLDVRSVDAPQPIVPRVVQPTEIIGKNVVIAGYIPSQKPDQDIYVKIQ